MNYSEHNLNLVHSGWEAPQPLIFNKCANPYPAQALPDTIRNAAEQIQDYVQAPMSLVAASALSAVSLACQHMFDVYRDSRLVSPTSLNFISIANSGERKSACDSFFTSEIRAFQNSCNLGAKPEIEKFKSRLDIWQASYDGVRSEIKSAVRKGEEISSLSQRLETLRRTKPIKPKFPHLLYTDVTPEGLAFNLVDKWPSGGIIVDEGGNFLGSHAMGKNSVVKTFGLLNTLWDAKQFQVDRRGAESFVVDGARLTVSLMVQEATLNDFLSGSGELARGTGFLARFLMSWPESTQGDRPYKEPDNSMPHYQNFNNRIHEILNTSTGLDDRGMLNLPGLYLSPAGKDAWVTYHNGIENDLREGGELYDIRDCAAKSADNVVRMAALFHIFERRVGPIGPDLVSRAALICSWHLSESLRFFNSIALPIELANAVKLDAYLIRECNKRNTNMVLKNIVRQYGPLRQKNNLVNALSELIKLDRIRMQKHKNIMAVEVNPALLLSKW